MDTNGFDNSVDARNIAGRPATNMNGGHPIGPPVPEQSTVIEQIGLLRREVERLREEQHALQRSPKISDPDDADETGEDEPNKANPENPRDSGRSLWRRPLVLLVMLVMAVFLCVGGLRFWNYVQSYEWTDDAEIEGHLDPISTRIDVTVAHVYVETPIT
jgi:hypothetical protein